jgi:alkanesulfonate monooxygenase SsuD/methylene tetrahydromethanopterin reductase-like flavin-dependent oxidoreductase (luciferase family)
VGPERQGGIGCALRDAYAWHDLAGLGRAAADLGYGALFLPEVGARDTLAALTGLAGEVGPPTRLGTGVVPLPARSVPLLAVAAATAQERSGGRLILGLGTGPAVAGALDRLRDVVVALRTAFATGEGELDGERFRLGLVPPEPPPIWIAALGPRAVRLAGELADGVLLNWCTPERVAEATAAIHRTAADAGRDPAGVTIGVYVRAALTPGTDETLLVAAAEYGSYPGYARQFRAMGIDPGDAAAIAGAVCLRGDPVVARDRLLAYRQAGADLPVVYPIVRPRTPDRAPDPTEALATLRALAP